MPRPLFLILIFLSGACNHYYYAPNSLPMPTIREQHDAVVTGHIVAGDEIRAKEIQAAYSPLPYLMLQFQHFNVKGKPNTFASTASTDPSAGDGRLTEGGLAFYYPSGGSGVFSLGAGYGLGRAYNDYGGLVTSELNFRRLYIQPSLTFETEYLQGGMACRLVQLAYLNGAIDGRTPPEDLEALRRIEYNSPMLIPEFGLFIGAGVKPIYVNLQLNHSASRSGYKFVRTTIGLSLTYRPDHLWKR